MALFKKKTQPLAAIYVNLNAELEKARKLKRTSFYYPLKGREIDKAMSWGVHNRVGIQIDHITDNKTYYKFFGYSMED